MVPLQPRAQGAEDLKALSHSGWRDVDGPEAAGQGRVRFHAAAVFFPGSGADDLYAAPSQCGLEQIGRVDGALGAACPHQRVELVEKENDVSCLCRLRQQIPDALFKFSAVFRSCHQSGHIQAPEVLPGQLTRHLSPGDPAGQFFYDGSFPHPRGANQRRTILIPATEHPHQLRQLLLPAEHGLRRLPPSHRYGKLFQ